MNPQPCKAGWSCSVPLFRRSAVRGKMSRRRCWVFSNKLGQLVRLKNGLDFLAYVGLRIFVHRRGDADRYLRGNSPMVGHALLQRAAHSTQRNPKDNLQHAFPQMSAAERDDLSWRMWEHLFLMVVEVIHTPRKIHHTNWRELHHAAQRAGHGSRGMFDADRPNAWSFAATTATEGLRLYAESSRVPTPHDCRPLDNPYLDRYLNEFRGLTGQYILSKTGSSAQIESVLARGGVLAALGDQYAGPKGCWVRFFAVKPTPSHKAIALYYLGKFRGDDLWPGARHGKPIPVLGCQGSLTCRVLKC